MQTVASHFSCSQHVLMYYDFPKLIRKISSTHNFLELFYYHLTILVPIGLDVKESFKPTLNLETNSLIMSGIKL